jgi:hypothetical protein
LNKEKLEFAKLAGINFSMSPFHSKEKSEKLVEIDRPTSKFIYTSYSVSKHINPKISLKKLKQNFSYILIIKTIYNRMRGGGEEIFFKCHQMHSA